ncbi:MAG: hypothetical protein ACI9J4_001115 [Paraglaciecola sp.]|jgi:hypothetical protein
MSIDIANTFSDMAKTAGQSLEQDGASISSGFSEALKKNQASIAELVQARVDGEINDEDFATELAREKLIVEAEMISLEIASKAAVQKAVNAAIDVLTQAVSAAI